MSAYPQTQLRHERNAGLLLIAAAAAALIIANSPLGDSYQHLLHWKVGPALPRVGQHENVALVSYRLAPETRLMFTHVYAARSGLVHHLSGDTLILEAGRPLD